MWQLSFNAVVNSCSMHCRIRGGVDGSMNTNVVGSTSLGQAALRFNNCSLSLSKVCVIDYIYIILKELSKF